MLYISIDLLYGDNMSGERYYYYYKLITNSPPEAGIDYYLDISRQLENDSELYDGEMFNLEELINKFINGNSPASLKVINSVTGMEEEPPKTPVDDFGGNASFIGREIKYGIKWNIYEPRANNNLFFKKWYYNEKISSILDKVFINIVPGKLSNYFDVPPWIFGNFSYRGISYKPLKEIIDKAIEKEIIPNKYYLVSKGIPKELIDNLKESDMWL